MLHHVSAIKKGPILFCKQIVEREAECGVEKACARFKYRNTGSSNVLFMGGYLNTM